MPAKLPLGEADRRKKERCYKYYLGHREQDSARRFARYWSDPEKGRADARAWREANLEQARASNRRYAKMSHDRDRLMVLVGYGHKCACCSETEAKFLALDHVHGGGSIHRKALKWRNKVYRLVISNGFPPEYQILCHNCNMAKAFYGQCPHQDSKVAVHEAHA